MHGGNPTTIACDGEHRWQVYPGQTMVGPAAPLRCDLADLIDASWLLGCRPASESEITYRGRRAYQLRVTPGDPFSPAGPLLFFPADAIVDVETSCLLRLISYAGDRPASWWELRDIGTEPGDPGEFRVHVRWRRLRHQEHSGRPPRQEPAARGRLAFSSRRPLGERGD